jgi:hypothetical protein
VLNAAGEIATAGPTVSRWRAVRVAVVPTARGIHLGAAAATVAAAAIPAVVAVARGDTVVTVPLVIAGLVAGATLGWAADDPAADLLGAMPVSSPVRAALRVACAAPVAAVGAALVALVVAVGPGLPSDLGDRGPEASAAAALALAVGFLAARRGERTAGPVGVTAGVLGPAVVAGLAFRWPHLFPGFMPNPVHYRWWFVVAVGAAVVARSGRDPGRR